MPAACTLNSAFGAFSLAWVTSSNPLASRIRSVWFQLAAGPDLSTVVAAPSLSSMRSSVSSKPTVRLTPD